MDTSRFTDDFSMSPQALALKLGQPEAPLVLDVRRATAFEADTQWLPGALRREPGFADQWAASLPTAAMVLVYCVHGHEVSREAAATLRRLGVAACHLQGGIEAWRAQLLPMQAKPSGLATRWVTRERPRIDRVACPWLVLRFIDAQAQFLYVPPEQVAAVAERERATAYDVSERVASTPYTHVGEQCSFDAFVRLHGLGGDAALCLLADIVRGADTDRLDLAPACAGLLAVSLGMARLHAGADLAMLQAMLPVYDALYAWCRDVVAGRAEGHSWRPA